MSSLLLGLIGKFSGIALLGGAVFGGVTFANSVSSSNTTTETVDSSTESSEEIKLDNLGDYKKHCKVLTSMTQTQEEGQEEINAYLLICKTAPEEIKTYLYKHKPTQQPLKEVKSYTFEHKGASLSLTPHYYSGEYENFNLLLSANLDKLNGAEIKTKCSINSEWQYSKLPCTLPQGGSHTYYLTDLVSQIG